MKKLFISIFALASLVLAGHKAQAALDSGGPIDNKDFSNPNDANGHKAQSVDEFGLRVASYTSSQQVSNILDDNTVEAMWHTGAGILYGVEVGSGATTGYVVCTDTDTANNAAGVSVAEINSEQVLLTIEYASVAGTQRNKGRDFPKEFKSGLMCDRNDDIWYHPIFKAANGK